VMTLGAFGTVGSIAMIGAIRALGAKLVARLRTIRAIRTKLVAPPAALLRLGAITHALMRRGAPLITTLVHRARLAPRLRPLVPTDLRPPLAALPVPGLVSIEIASAHPGLLSRRVMDGNFGRAPALPPPTRSVAGRAGVGVSRQALAQRFCTRFASHGLT